MKYDHFRMLRALGLGLLLSVLIGCSYVRITHEPMPFEKYEKLGPQKARGVIVLLPGFGDRASTFEKRGFIDVLAKRAPEYDLVATDAHFGYYRKRILVPRLEQDVVAPLRAQGYREIWLAGTSMGGFGAIGYARSYPDSITGLLLFAPYMGKGSVLKEIRAAGGLCKWQQSKIEHVTDEESFSRANMAWLHEQACAENGKPMYLGVGDADGLVAADRVLGDALDPTHLLVLPGGHGWKVWTPALDTLAQRAFVEKASEGSEAAAVENAGDVAPVATGTR